MHTPELDHAGAQGDLFPRLSLEWAQLYATQLIRRVAALPPTIPPHAIELLLGELALAHRMVDRLERWEITWALVRPGVRVRTVRAAPPESLYPIPHSRSRVFAMR